MEARSWDPGQIIESNPTVSQHALGSLDLFKPQFTYLENGFQSPTSRRLGKLEMALFVISGGHSANLSQSQAWALGTKAREGAEESWERAHPGGWLVRTRTPESTFCPWPTLT